MRQSNGAVCPVVNIHANPLPTYVGARRRHGITFTAISRSRIRFRKRASEGYDEASGRVGNAVDELARKSNRVRDDVAESVVRGAHEVERFAVAVKSETSKSRG